MTEPRPNACDCIAAMLQSADRMMYTCIPLKEAARFMPNQSLTDMILAFDSLKDHIIKHSRQDAEGTESLTACELGISIVNFLIMHFLDYYHIDASRVLSLVENFYAEMHRSSTLPTLWEGLSCMNLCNICIDCLTISISCRSVDYPDKCTISMFLASMLELSSRFQNRLDDIKNSNSNS